MADLQKMQAQSDYVIEVIAKQGRLIDNVWTDTSPDILTVACFYRDYEIPERKELSNLHSAVTALERLYQHWPDGEVEIKLTIKKEMINV